MLLESDLTPPRGNRPGCEKEADPHPAGSGPSAPKWGARRQGPRSPERQASVFVAPSRPHPLRRLPRSVLEDEDTTEQ